MGVANRPYRVLGGGLRAGLLCAMLVGTVAFGVSPVAGVAGATRTLRVWYATDDPTEAPVIEGLAATL